MQGLAGGTGEIPKKRPLRQRHAPANYRGGFNHISPARPRDADPLP